MRVKVILNPWSDQGRAARHEEEIRAAGKRHGGLEIVKTEYPGHGRELARGAADEGYDLIVAAGGDGTVHEVVNGIMDGGRHNTLLGVIPIGTGNDFAFGLSIPLNDVDAAVGLLYSGKVRQIDLARIEDDRNRSEFFDNNVGIGTDAIVVMRSEAMTRLHGFLLYVVAVVQTIAFFYRTIGLTVKFDDEEVKQESLLLAGGIGPRGGGGFFLTPDAAQDDDLIDTCIADPIGRLTMMILVARSLKGRHVTSKHVTMRKSRQIVVRSDSPMPIHIDGEMFAYPRDNVRHVTITSVPAALRVLA